MGNKIILNKANMYQLISGHTLEFERPDGRSTYIVLGEIGVFPVSDINKFKGDVAKVGGVMNTIDLLVIGKVDTGLNRGNQTVLESNFNRKELIYILGNILNELHYGGTH